MTQAVALAQQASTGVSQGFKNRIINGNMTIDQRNAGASKSVAAGIDTYTLDRWYVNNQTDGAFTVQQDAGAVTPPVGFNDYLGITITTADSSLAAGQYVYLAQLVEGFNFADLNWGTANAKTVTFSFWVRSSLTGTFGGAFRNSAVTRSYAFTYTISAANTWEYKTITVAGDTSGTWVGATNGVGVQIDFGLGVGSTFSGTAGAWVGSNLLTATGAVSVVGTNGATFYITGVQLEVGSTATSFDYRPYGTELNLCERYCRRYGDGLTGVAPGATSVFLCPFFLSPMRATPTVTLADTSVKITDNYASDYTSTGSTLTDTALSAFGGRINVNGFTGLTTARVYQAYDNTNGFFFVISAEL